jgi:hypothetical protein
MRTKPKLSPLKLILIALGGIWAFGLLTGIYVAKPNSTPTVLTAPLIMQIQSLGQLHTVRYNVQDVLEHERHLEPQGWVSSLPGASALYESTTRNKVLVVANGGVEAGVDLSQVGLQNVTKVITPQGTKVRIQIPHATLFAPEVHVKVVNRQAGVFWNDDNIVPEATQEVERRFKETASKNGILASAETNAVKMLSNMQAAAGNPNVEFYF